MPKTEPLIGQSIRSARTDRGLTQKQLADAAGMAPNALAMIERGERAPSWSTACAIADALGVSVARLRRG